MFSFISKSQRQKVTNKQFSFCKHATEILWKSFYDVTVHLSTSIHHEAMRTFWTIFDTERKTIESVFQKLGPT